MEELTKPEPTLVVKKSQKVPLLIALVIVLALATVGVFVWQHQQASDAADKLAAANNQASALRAKNATLQKQYDTAKADLQTASSGSSTPTPKTVSYSQIDLAVVVNGAEYVNPGGLTTASAKWFGVNITATNNTVSSITLNDKDFHLKDASDTEYDMNTVGGATTLPHGWVSMPFTKTLEPGEAIKGTVTFNTPNSTTLQNFTFYNVSKGFPVVSPNTSVN